MTAHTEHEVVERFQPPDGNMKIWRYVDLPKLIDFLETGSLHFARADTLGDPYEGSWTLLNLAARGQQIREMIADAEMKYTPEKLQQEFERLTHHHRQTHVHKLLAWRRNESAAMWKLYGTAAGSIAIQSTYKKLVDVLPDDAFMGMVQYKNYSSLKDWVPADNIMYPFIHKRREFEHEKEVRAFIWIRASDSEHRQEKVDDCPQGIKVDIDSDKAVETIPSTTDNTVMGKGINQETPREIQLGHEGHAVADRHRTRCTDRRCTHASGERMSPP